MNTISLMYPYQKSIPSLMKCIDMLTNSIDLSYIQLKVGLTCAFTCQPGSDHSESFWF